MKTVDTLIHAGWIVPVEPESVVLEQHSIAIQDGHILDLLPTAEARDRYQAEHEFDKPGHLLMPGLINAHTHAAMSLMRGLTDDLPLMRWLSEHIWPAEGKWVSPEFVRDGSRLAMAEMLRGGTTCFNDMYFFPDEVARLAEQTGMRAVVGLIVIDFPTAWAQDSDEYIHKGFAVHDQVKHSPLVTTAFAPHGPYTVSDEPLQKIVMYAEELDIPVHMHVHETAHEVTEGIQQHGKRPLSRLAELGLVSPRLLAVHMTQLDEDEIAIHADANAHVVHCPESNLKLASGFCPVQRLLDAGVNVALGTDGAASNNDLDMFGEMRTAALLAKGVAGDASALPAYRALEMATINGARALGLDAVCGSLVAGKAADIVAVKMDDLETQPLYHAISQLVYATARDKVSDVWVAGRHLLKDSQLTTLDEAAILDTARRWQNRLIEQS
ncbi:MAG: TRZ/ATZ family hydrolase [Gammaproteobacteria bacterium]|nr:TRZ/ATZ family hydrolase [Gammaproteobacteria bacterium]MCW8841181.1 TRZ/ATZ family hydrolase [Gammaproteobacteria bacterium]MCW8927980.1 TRZ/ATZ family hydrolase [Gammaproteobacteria bacterium]MCW8958419.1 TRZ/ATZ family hydrolase [Gammaproteobacteria bacterium]MCW8973947.1 TRZ/ATZ family hydrolase [Gammaproteobacteria bacterium]